MAGTATDEPGFETSRAVLKELAGIGSIAARNADREPSRFADPPCALFAPFPLSDAPQRSLAIKGTRGKAKGRLRRPDLGIAI